MMKVSLIASDQGKFEIEESVAKKSQLLKNMIEDTGIEEEIYLPNVKSSPLEKIIKYCDHYRNSEPPEIEKPLPKASLKELVDPWDEEFIDIKNQEELLELLLAANYLDIRSLIELCCAKVATMIKGIPHVILQASPRNKSGKHSASSTISPPTRKPRSVNKIGGPTSAHDP